MIKLSRKEEDYIFKAVGGGRLPPKSQREPFREALHVALSVLDPESENEIKEVAGGRRKALLALTALIFKALLNVKADPNFPACHIVNSSATICFHMGITGQKLVTLWEETGEDVVTFVETLDKIAKKYNEAVKEAAWNREAAAEC